MFHTHPSPALCLSLLRRFDRIFLRLIYCSLHPFGLPFSFFLWAPLPRPALPALGSLQSSSSPHCPPSSSCSRLGTYGRPPAPERPVLSSEAPAAPAPPLPASQQHKGPATCPAWRSPLPGGPKLSEPPFPFRKPARGNKDKNVNRVRRKRTTLLRLDGVNHYKDC